ncbi:type II toxin-antitoxin system VapC family toxin [Desulfonatronum thioautotrophicum]|uniref:type II toxin-antitoxin system VapC family toxin n=1 Tax=Desulfonatronum thioautotrophicum TaxID=617001 RepID=UPI001ABF5043|nr:PIN domain-containing protein [Desulfonatronum thioautotrophicum]
MCIDTWGWINIFNRKESHHHEVTEIYHNVRNTRGIIITTDYILDEVYTLLFKRVSFDVARQAVEAISKAIEDAYLNFVWITPERFKAAQILRIKFQDKPDISFTDLTSMVVMQELKISEIVTGDAHFTHVGMGFSLLP